MMKLGITGTDTGVGKSVIASATVAWLRNRGVKVAAMKPIESGEQLADAKLLQRAVGFADPLEDICPVHFREPIAPFAAALKSGTSVKQSRLDDAYARLAEGRDAIVVEGAGGLLVPITRELSFASLFKRWDLSLLIVAANKLGVLNHTLLTLRVARLLGINVAGIVLNYAPLKSRDASLASNLEVLRQLVPEVPLIAFPHIQDPLNLFELIDVVESSSLGALLESGLQSTRVSPSDVTQIHSQQFPNENAASS